uniref:Uncharacterized protein n=1 Tax=Ditylenchus dipsaci TaxID=166011 RepID=A0A915E3B5_9BILA
MCRFQRHYYCSENTILAPLLAPHYAPENTNTSSILANRMNQKRILRLQMIMKVLEPARWLFSTFSWPFCLVLLC